METASCMKTVVASSHQFQSSPTDENLIHLQRQLDVLIGVTSQGAATWIAGSKQLLVTECLACLHDILTGCQAPTSLTHKALVVLNNLAQNDEVRESLHDVFQLPSCLVGCLLRQPASVSDPVVLLCLKLLQTITYNRQVSCEQNYVVDLVKYLMQHIADKEGVLTVPLLSLMANLCRHNPPIQTHITSQTNIKPFFKSLIGYLSHGNQTVVIVTLCILTSLCLKEEFGLKLFNAQNINQTLQLVFNMLVNAACSLSQRYAADLLIDLVGQTSAQHALARHQHLGVCLQQILDLLDSANEQTVVKAFELLLAFCCVPAIRSKLCRILFPSELGADADSSSSFVTVVQSATREAIHSTDLQALDFLQHIYQEVLNDGETTTPPPCTRLLLPMLAGILAPSAGIDPQPKQFALVCLRLDKALRLLLTLCVDKGLRTTFCRTIDTNSCVSLLDFQFSNNRVVVSGSVSQTLDDWSGAGADVVLHTLELMLALMECVDDMQVSFCQAIQDSRVVPFLARGVTSGCRLRVRSALKLVSMGATLDKFPSVILGDSIATFNASRSSGDAVNHAVNHTVDHAANHAGVSTGPAVPNADQWLKQRPPSSNWLTDNKENVSGMTVKSAVTPEIDTVIQSLIRNMQSNFELKDLRASEMICIFEHQLQSLQTNQSHLQNLLDAKAKELVQAERLIAQYRYRNVQSDTEAGQLRALLQRSERGTEDLREQLNEEVTKRDRIKVEIDQLLQEIARLERIAEEHRDLIEEYAEQTQKLENMQRTLTALQQERENMTEMSEMLRRHNNSLKQQHDVASRQLAELEDEKKAAAKQLKEKEAKVHELSQSLAKCEEERTEVARERNDLEVAVDKLRGELGFVAEAKKQIQHQVSTLELLCRQHEVSLQEKDSLLCYVNSKLDKQAQIAALIHDLSSGRTAPGAGGTGGGAGPGAAGPATSTSFST